MYNFRSTQKKWVLYFYNEKKKTEHIKDYFSYDIKNENKET